MWPALMLYTLSIKTSAVTFRRNLRACHFNVLTAAGVQLSKKSDTNFSE